MGYLSPRGRLLDLRQQLADYEELIPEAFNARIRDFGDKVDEYEELLHADMGRQLTDAKHRLALRIERMKGASPLDRLNQGFSYVQREDGRTVRRVADVREKERLNI